MGRRKVREYEETVPDLTSEAAAAAAELAEQQVPEDDIGEIFRLTDEVRATAGVMCQFMRTAPSHLVGYCGQMLPADFSLEKVREKFGPGNYTVRLKGPMGYVRGGGKMVIAGPPDGSEPVSAGGTRESAADIIAALEKRATEQAAARSSELKSWAGILAPILAPAVLRLFEKKNDLADAIKAMAALRELEPPREKPPELLSQLDTLAGAIAKMREVSDEAKPTSGSTWVDVIRDGIREGLPVLQGVVAQLRPGAPPPPPIPRPLLSAPPAAATSSHSQNGATAPGSTPPTSPAAGEPMGMIQLASWFGACMVDLVPKAAQDKDPELYAEVILDSLPPGTDTAMLVSLIERPDWWQQLCTFAPQVAPYPAWFQYFRDAVLTMLKSARVEPTPPAPGADDVQLSDG